MAQKKLESKTLHRNIFLMDWDVFMVYTLDVGDFVVRVLNVKKIDSESQ